MKTIPHNFFTVSVSLSLPDELKSLVDSWDTDLSPGNNIFKEYKSNKNWDRYIERFKLEILPNIDWLEKLESWEEKANKISKEIDNIVLLCYEKPFDCCHRHILSENFEEEFKCKVKEFGFEKMIKDKKYKLVIDNNMDILF